jgi:hypothetical protein
MRKNSESKALREVWEWKSAAYREVEHLDTKSALKKRLEDSLKTVKERGIAWPRKTKAIAS